MRDNVRCYADNTFVTVLRHCSSFANTMLGSYLAAVLAPITWIHFIRVVRYPRCALLLDLFSYEVQRIVRRAYYSVAYTSTWYFSQGQLFGEVQGTEWNDEC